MSRQRPELGIQGGLLASDRLAGGLPLTAAAAGATSLQLKAPSVQICTSRTSVGSQEPERNRNPSAAIAANCASRSTSSQVFLFSVHRGPFISVF
jgi:hypothetical protein